MITSKILIKVSLFNQNTYIAYISINFAYGYILRYVRCFCGIPIRIILLIYLNILNIKYRSLFIAVLYETADISDRASGQCNGRK